jgi:RNA polymerase sigma factor (sigma-70 family)
MAIYSRMNTPVHCREWITCLQQGEEKALEYFYQTYHRGIYDFAYRIVQNKDDAADIAQESFMKLWASRQSIRDETHVRNSLYLDAKRSSLMCLRRKNRQLLREGEFNYFSLAQQDAEEMDMDLEVAMQGYSALDLLYTDIETLPPGCREIFKLYYFEKKSTKQIAADGAQSKDPRKEPAKTAVPATGSIYPLFYLPDVVIRMIFAL